MQLLERSFEAFGHRVMIRASVMPNTDPVAFGSTIIFPQYKPEDFLGYPVIKATVHSDHAGYGSMFGWIQFVESTSNAHDTTNDHGPTDTQEGCADLDWQLDAIPLFQDLNTPFIYFGSDPTLFDAPARVGKDEVKWRAQSYLTHVSDAVITRQVTPVLGFTWGFDVENGAKCVAPLEELDLKTSWNERLDALRRSHANWTFKAAE